MSSKQALFASVALGLVVAVSAVPAEAQRGGRWLTLNSVSVRPGVSSETMWITNRDGLREARLCVKRRSVGINNVQINFDRGPSQRVPVRRVIRAGECSLPVSLQGGGRDRIRSVRVDLTRFSSGTRPYIILEARVSPEVSPGVPAPPLVGTEWRLVEFESSDDSVGTIRPANNEVYTLRFLDDRSLIMTIVCNRGRGSWSSNDANRLRGSLAMKPALLTRATCTPPPRLNRLPQHLENVRSFVIQDGRLHLNLMMDAGNYVWAPVR